MIATARLRSLAILTLLMSAATASAQPVTGSEASPSQTDPDGVRDAPVDPCFDEAGPDPAEQQGSETKPARGSDAEPAGNGRLLTIVDDRAAAQMAAPAGGLIVESTGTDERDTMSFWYDSTAARVRLSHRASEGAPVAVMDLSHTDVFEFTDEDGDGAFDEGERIVSTFGIASLVGTARTQTGSCGVRLFWTYAIHDPAEVLATIERMDDPDVAEGKSDAEVQAERDAYYDSLPKLGLTFTHAGEPIPLAQGGISPDRVKIDIMIDDYPFAESGTNVAVRSVLASDGPALAEGARLAQGEVGYGWAEEAIVDGASAAVGATLLPAATPEPALASAQAVVFAYPASTAIVHDPELGVYRAMSSDVELQEGTAATPGAPIVLLVATLGVVAAAARRRMT